ncbi:dienelactone hydrolase family protein [Terasakiella sp. SH-1]|uniref:alpha/beta hydrolase n=1 Tax=Terasakiella sp. SH-1 TaxID=2560057 RepID=UPI001073468B|nr:dienelactone hydrolase family protein [Terasakiella sp. SH-1]
MVKLQGPELHPEHKEITSLVVMLHGFGADGQDLIGLAPCFSQPLPNTVFHAPDGAQPCEISPFGRQWFSLAQSDPEYLRRNAETQDIAFEGMYDEACKAAGPIENYIDSLMEDYQLHSNQVALVGFSQGTMMALHIGLRRTSPFACIVGFSGALVGASHLAAEKQADCPVLLVHGEADDMLPVRAVDLAAEGLKQAGVSPQVIKRPGLPHAIDEVGTIGCANFLRTHLQA